jgi:hypothetical protein
LTIPGLIDAVRPRPVPPAAADVLRGDAASSSTEDALFRSLKLRNGTWKVTEAGRLTDVDELISAHLPPGDPLRVCDVGISSGVTTAEWFDALTRLDRSFSMTAIDRDLNGFLIEVGGLVTVLTDRDGFPLQYSSRVAVHGVATHRDRLRQPLRRLVASAATGRALRDARRDATTDSRTLGLRVRCEPVRIVSPRLGRLPVDLQERDLSDLGESQFDVIRVANVLNRSYFETEVLQGMVRRLFASLRRGGILVVAGSPRGQPNVATIFRRSDDASAEVVAQLGGGHEIEDLVTERSPSGATGAGMVTPA